MKKLLVGLLLLALAIAAVFGYQRFQARPLTVSHLDGTIQLVTPRGQVEHRVIIAVPDSQRLTDADLARLAQDSRSVLLQFSPPGGQSCPALLAQLQGFEATLGGPADRVAGIGPGAMLAWRWLAAQDTAQAKALSVGFDLSQPDCQATVPQHNSKGQWLVAWHENPGDLNARFARAQEQAEVSISDYGLPLPQLLQQQLQRLLLEHDDGVPAIEVPATQPANDTVSLFYSGDGGWRDLDRASARVMASQGWPVVGIDSMRYFWQHKSAEQAAADLSRLMSTYQEKWGARRFALIGYSFGADVLPTLYNHLPAQQQQQVSAILLLALAPTGSLEIEVGGWLGQQGGEIATGPELQRIPAGKVLCIYGAQEREDSGCLQPGLQLQTLELTGGHHFDQDYDALAGHLIQAIRQRNPS